MDGAVTCAACGTGNPQGARFCVHCGRSLEVAELTCPSCSTQLPAGSRFCFNCGHELTAGSTSGQQGQPAQAVTASIADQLRASGPGERRRITLLFCDVQDSTATAERLDPEDWSDIMREALSRFIAPVERYGGTVARILGDAILAYFGAPVAHEDDPQRAVLAGLAITESCRELAETVQRRYGLPFGVRVGINTGLVVVGDVGSTLYGEYAALGDAANVAARMEQTAQAGTVRIAEPTHRLVSALFDVNPIGPVEVKGRQEPVTAYRVVAAKDTPGPVRGIPGLHSPVVGRDVELAQLRGALSALLGGDGQVVSLIADAGLGKSRLAAELASEFEAATGGDGVWIEGGCYSYESATPYTPVRRALRALFGLGLDGGDHAVVAERMTGLLGPDGRRQAAYLAGVIGTEPSEQDQEFVRFLEPPMLRQRVFAAAGALVSALAGRGPVVITIEDLHWADPASVELVQSLLPLTEQLPVMVLLRLRPNRGEPSWAVHEAAAGNPSYRYTAIELATLEPDAARDLVGNLLRVEGLSATVRKLILRKSDGNPFFVEEVIRSLLDAGVVVREGERFVVTTDVDDVAVPDTLVGVLSARIDALATPTRRVLQTAAVLGRDFAQDVLRELVDRTELLDVALAELEHRELIVETVRSPERRFMFKHTLTMQTAYDTLLVSTRRDVHRMVGKLIEERHPERVHDLAHHFMEADEPFRALPYLVGAADSSAAAFAMPDAARLYQQALDNWSDGQDTTLARRAYEGLGQARMMTGDLPGALQTFNAMEAFAQEQDDAGARTSALNKQALVHLFGTGNVVEAERLLLAARTEAKANGDASGLAEFHVGYCVLNLGIGRIAEATEHLGEAAEVCFDLDPFHRNFGLTHYAGALMYQLRLDESRTAMERARQQALQDRDKLHMAHLLMLEGELDLFAGDGPHGLNQALEAVDIAVEIGAPLEESMASWGAGVLAARLGEYEVATAQLERAAAIGGQIGFFGTVTASHSALAVVHQAIYGTGTERLRELVAQAQAGLNMPLGAYMSNTVYADLAAVFLAEGELDEAATAAQQATDARSSTVWLVPPEASLCAGRVALQRGETESGLAHLREAARYVQEHGLSHFLPATLLGEAVIASYAGDTDLMVDKINAADEAATRMRLRPAALLVRTQGAELLAAAGRPEEAAEFRSRAAKTATEIAGLIQDPDTRAAFVRSHALVAG